MRWIRHECPPSIESVATSRTGRPFTRAHDPRSILVWSTRSFTRSHPSMTWPTPSSSIVEPSVASPRIESEASVSDPSIKTDISRTIFAHVATPAQRNTAHSSRMNLRIYFPSSFGKRRYFWHSHFLILISRNSSSHRSRIGGFSVWMIGLSQYIYGEYRERRTNGKEKSLEIMKIFDMILVEEYSLFLFLSKNHWDRGGNGSKIISLEMSFQTSSCHPETFGYFWLQKYQKLSQKEILFENDKK